MDHIFDNLHLAEPIGNLRLKRSFQLSHPGKLCCNAALGKVSFEALGTASGKCKFTYGRD